MSNRMLSSTLMNYSQDTADEGKQVKKELKEVICFLAFLYFFEQQR